MANKDLLQKTREFFDSLGNWDYLMIKELCASDVKWNVCAPSPIGGSYRGIKDVLSLLKKLEHRLPKGLYFIFDKIVLQDNTVAVEWRDYGKLRDGSSYENHGMNFIRYTPRGKVKDISEIVDGSRIHLITNKKMERLFNCSSQKRKV